MTLSRAGCARLHLKASGPKPPNPWEGLSSCRGCPIGAFHTTGVQQDPVVAISAVLNTLCARCLQKSDRLIWGMYCASCDARQREFVRGRNSKGHVPAMAKLLHTERLVVASAGQVKPLVRKSVITLAEVIIHASRHATHPLAFGPRRITWPDSVVIRSGPHQPWASQIEFGGMAGGTGRKPKRRVLPPLAVIAAPPQYELALGRAA